MSNIKLPQIFSHNMVLQRDKKILVWGSSDDNKEIKVTLNNKSYGTIPKKNNWKIELEPMKAGGPYVLVIEQEDTVVSFSNVMIGEVWLAGGQSNMELELQNSENGLTEIENAHFENIRFYNVLKTAYIDEKSLNEEKNQNWKMAIGDACKDMSAVAFHFAKKLNDVLDVTIGIIDCYWGGTSAMCWMSEDYLLSDEDTKKNYDEYLDIINHMTDEDYENEMAKYNEEYEDWNQRVEAMKAVDPNVTWEILNEQAGLCPWPQPMGRKSPFRPGGLHETMIMRVAPFSLRGFIYYQGEEDWSRSLYYAKLNEMVIKQWREDFQDENLPFILTQLPMYIAKGDIDDKNWCILREQQELVTRNINHVSMAVTIDCGEFDNIHPIDKKTPGDRLALQSLGKVYGVLKKYDNMYIREVKYTGEIVIMEFENVYDGIKQVREIEGFEVAGSDLLFVKATAQISGKLIFAHNEQVKAPKYVRYAWTNFGKVNVYNSEGLPLAPFRK